MRIVLSARASPIININFPRYEQESVARSSSMYLDGAFGAHPSDVNAYAASHVFAVDRYASYKHGLGRVSTKPVDF